MLKISGFVFCEIIIYAVLKRNKPEFAILSEVISGVIVIFMLTEEIDTALRAVDSLLDCTGISVQHINILIKIAGLALISQFTADLCRDAGENAAASKVEFAGKVMIISVSLPVIKGITGLIVRMIENV